MASMSDPLQVAQLEKGLVKAENFSVADVLAISTQVGLTVERLLPFRLQLTSEEKAMWEAERQRVEAGPVVPVDGESSLDPDTTLQLFIRFQALQELFKRAADSAVPAHGR